MGSGISRHDPRWHCRIAANSGKGFPIDDPLAYQLREFGGKKGRSASHLQSMSAGAARPIRRMQNERDSPVDVDVVALLGRGHVLDLDWAAVGIAGDHHRRLTPSAIKKRHRRRHAGGGGALGWFMMDART